MTHDQAKQISKLVWKEGAFSVFLLPNGNLVDANGVPLSHQEASDVRACLNYKSTD